MTKSSPKIELELAFEDPTQKKEALRYARREHFQDVPLVKFLALYPARGVAPLPADYWPRPLKHFTLKPLAMKPGEGVPLQPDRGSDSPAGGELRSTLDQHFADDVGRDNTLAAFPERLTDTEAVQIAYRHELRQIARYLEHDLSVLIMCDKMLTGHIYEYVCKRAGKRPVLEDDIPLPPGQSGQQRDRAAFEQAMSGQRPNIETTLPLLVRSLKNDQVLVLRSVDLLDSPSLVETLYQGAGSGKKVQLLGFLDPSLEVKKVLTDRFAIRVQLMGLPRYIQPDPKQPPVHTVTRLITADEGARFQTLDPEALYKNVSGFNPIQFRNAMRYVGAAVAKNSSPRRVFNEIRQFKTSGSDEIVIPDTNFEQIGGYEHVKRELQQIIALIAGRVRGLSQQERNRLIPRGFIFHGPPGTGKTLFAKAIANELNATIQMVSGPEIMDKYVGQSESNLRRIFATARRNAPSVIFFDEFDSLASQRSTYSDGGARANNAVVAQLLTELDGFREENTVLVIGTTNRLDIIDEALLRPSRLKPVQIGRPDITARKSVARIHARNFGVDQLLFDLLQQVMHFLPAWQQQGKVPEEFKEALFEQHPPYRARYELDEQRLGFLKTLEDMFGLVYRLQTGEEGLNAGTTSDSDLLLRMEKRLREIAGKYGLNLTLPDKDKDSESTLAPVLESDLADLFDFLQQQRQPVSRLTPDTLLDSVLSLVAEYSDGFNNDEIRAVFQEASLEHHLEGQLVTPRYLGLKIGLIRKRRDERQIVHIGDRR